MHVITVYMYKVSKKDLSQKIFYRMSYTTMDLVISGEIKGRKFELQLYLD